MGVGWGAAHARELDRVLSGSVGSAGAGEEWREQPGGESSGKWLGELVSGKGRMISRVEGGYGDTLILVGSDLSGEGTPASSR